MIGVHARNAQVTEGQARVDEMSALREATPAISNGKIFKVLGGIGAIILYLRSFRESGAVLAETQHVLPEQPERHIPMARRESDITLETEERALSRRIEEAAPIELDRFRAQDSAPVMNTGDAPSRLQVPMSDNDIRPLAEDITLPSAQDPAAEVPASQNPATQAPAPQGPMPQDPAPEDPEPQEPEPQEPEPQEPDRRVDCDTRDHPTPGEGTGTQEDTCEAHQCCDSQEYANDDAPSDEPGCESGGQFADIPRAKLFGTDGPDWLAGSDAAEEILLGAGDDTVDAGGGEDLVMAGAGNDRIDGNAGDDLLMGEAGDDVLTGGDGDDLVLGGTGADTLLAGSGNDRLDGGADNDVLRDGAGADVVLGSGGDDSFHLLADESVDFLDGGEGVDTLFLGEAASRTRTDFAAGTVEIDTGPADLFQHLEHIVASDALDVFDLSGLTRQDAMLDAPGFFQITDFGAGDTLRLSDELVLDFGDLLEDDRWGRVDEQSDLQMRMSTASPDSADAVPTRLSFRTGEDDRFLTRSVDFDLDQDGTTDFNLNVVIPHGDQHDQYFNM